LRKCKEKVAITCMRIVIRHLGSGVYTIHGSEYFIMMQVGRLVSWLRSYHSVCT
jgi:hypothetical protein